MRTEEISFLFLRLHTVFCSQVVIKRRKLDVRTQKSENLYLEQIDVVNLALKEEVIDGLELRP